MTYATVLLHLDTHPRLDHRIDFALRLARRFEAHLVGVAAADRTLYEMSLATGFSGRPQLQQALEECRLAARGRAAHFLQRAGELPLASVEAIVDDEDDVGALTMRSRCADLLVLGRPEAQGPHAGRARSQLEQLVLHSVAPTLVLPAAGTLPDAIDQVLIAWNGSPESARAVVGALPLLKRARRVQLLRCDGAQELARGGAPASLELPREWLCRHGIQIDTWLETSSLDAGQALQARAADQGADLLVMGAWGHSRWTERMLGGVTRMLLSTTTLPLLMSH